MNVGIGTEATQFLFWDYFVSNFRYTVVSLQCISTLAFTDVGRRMNSESKPFGILMRGYFGIF
jgi:hypothetical protein